MRSTRCLQIHVEIEGRPLLFSPRRERIMAEIDGLSPIGGPGFRILSGTGRDYMQVAGGEGAYVAEWREYAGDAFRHFAAGRHGPIADGWVKVSTNGFHVEVRSNERLSCDEVQAIAGDFVDGHGRSDAFAWRDMTAMFEDA